MKIFFIVNDLGVNEPFGPMLLSSIAKDNGHETSLGSIQLDKDNLTDKILSYKPDILAYSAMTVDMEDIKLFNNCAGYSFSIVHCSGCSFARA